MEKRTSSGCPLFVFCGVSSWGPVAENRKDRADSLATPPGRRARWKWGRAVGYDEVCGGRLAFRRASRGVPWGRQQAWRHDALSFRRSGNKIPLRQTATGTFHTDQRSVFSGVGESLRGGGDSFYKKRPSPLSMKPLQQRRTNLRGRLYRLRPWQGCPRSWPAQRGCAWRGGPGRSR